MPEFRNIKCGNRVDPISDDKPGHDDWQRQSELPACDRLAIGVTADAMGNIYGAEVGPRRLMKYVKN